MGNKHRRALKALKKAKKLGNIDGLTWYSWKDTGITEALEQLPLVSVQEHAGHTKPEMTLRYRHKKAINEKVKEGFKNTVI